MHPTAASNYVTIPNNRYVTPNPIYQSLHRSHYNVSNLDFDYEVNLFYLASEDDTKAYVDVTLEEFFIISRSNHANLLSIKQSASQFIHTKDIHTKDNKIHLPNIDFFKDKPSSLDYFKISSLQYFELFKIRHYYYIVEHDENTPLDFILEDDSEQELELYFNYMDRRCKTRFNAEEALRETLHQPRPPTITNISPHQFIRPSTITNISPRQLILLIISYIFIMFFIAISVQITK